ncbi:MAG TPA: PIG-L deacetylase family protein [Chitinophagaceae bacterium]|nr:PIG-L deacetylase family protein [Chitinophagaceae bacterium]
MPFNRRRFIRQASAGLGLLPLSALSENTGRGAAPPLRVVCVGGHPDDPESGCGGTLARLAAAGHRVTIIYLTRGEAGIPGKTHDEAAAIRTREAEAACAVLQATPFFAGQVDGSTVVDNHWVDTLEAKLRELEPDLVFTHWPVDTHKDHQCASLLTIQSYFRMQRKFRLYFFEVCTGEQTAIFHPTEYVDISGVRELKRKAVYCHQSQDPPGIYACGHAAMEEFRGRELGVSAAEGFVKMDGLFFPG